METVKDQLPRVVEAREIKEIAGDFKDPKEALREAISNAIDACATSVRVQAYHDESRFDKELVLEIQDDGVGMSPEDLASFFNLGDSRWQGRAEPRPCDRSPIGYKGHGTKIFLKSRHLEVETWTARQHILEEMQNPWETLYQGELPRYDYAFEDNQEDVTGTKITIRGFNQNQDKDFAHKILKDYVQWFTAAGLVEPIFRKSELQDFCVELQGLDASEPEQIGFGHLFAPESGSISQLKQQYPGDWPRYFVKRWVFRDQDVEGKPGVRIDLVISLEGDQVRRDFNPMVRPRGARGRPPYGTYTIEARYGLWACRDFIPVQRVNDWIGGGQQVWTKYHAFVNCQDFELTANRGDFSNTPEDVFASVQETVGRLFEEKVRGSREYQEYEAEVKLEELYQSAAEEGKEFRSRFTKARQKHVSKLNGIQLIEPRQEVGVVTLFSTASALDPSLFPFRVVDWDTRKGYDALGTHGSVFDLQRDMVSFIEFKLLLKKEFDHSFDHLIAVVCWDCPLPDGTGVNDLKREERVLKITPPTGERDYTTYMLTSSTKQQNIEVFVLKQYLKEKLNLDFSPRTAADKLL